jgi:alpha-tubulin suppressor-like RCC1 family protein
MRDLISNDILEIFIKEKATLVSCGFEHCLSLMDNGRVYTWGYGGSGCLGHGDYTSIEAPKMVFVSDVKYA